MTAIAVVAPWSGRYAPQIIVRPMATMAFVPLKLLKSRSCFKSVRAVVWSLNCIMLRSQRTRCEYSHCSNRWSFTSCVYSHHSNRMRWRGGGAYIHVNTVVETNYNNINIFYRDVIVIHVSKLCRSNNILIPAVSVCRQDGRRKTF